MSGPNRITSGASGMFARLSLGKLTSLLKFSPSRLCVEQHTMAGALDDTRDSLIRKKRSELPWNAAKPRSARFVTKGPEADTPGVAWFLPTVSPSMVFPAADLDS